MGHRTKRFKQTTSSKDNTRSDIKPKKRKGAYKKQKRKAPPAPKQERPEGSIRLNKAIAQSGYCSRRQADSLIEEKRVKINGALAQMGSFVYTYDDITIDGKALSKTGKRVYIAFNKPVGVECTTDLSVKDNIIDFIGYHQRIFPIGRLDKDSEGLILLTNDGDIVNPILRAGNAHEKEYIVRVNKPITNEFLNDMAKGVAILNTVTLPCKVQRIDQNTFSVILVQGLNRQIRRMCEALDYRVVALKRIRVMTIALGKLKIGTYRLLTPSEIDQLLKTIQ